MAWPGGCGEMVRSSHHDTGFHGWNAMYVAAHNTMNIYVMLTKGGISPYGPAIHRAIRVVSPRKTMAYRRQGAMHHSAPFVYSWYAFVDGYALVGHADGRRGAAVAGCCTGR